MTDTAMETIRLRLIDWQGAGWSRVPALSGAETIVDDLRRAGFVILRKQELENLQRRPGDRGPRVAVGDTPR